MSEPSQATVPPEQLLLLRDAVKSQRENSRRRMQKAKAELDASRLLSMAITGLQRDWRKPAHPDLTIEMVSCWSFLKRGRAYWVDPMIDDLSAAKRGRPKSVYDTRDLCGVPHGSMENADSSPCYVCDSDAYIVQWNHSQFKPTSFGGHHAPHKRRFLLCLDCQSIKNIDMKSCKVCEKVCSTVASI